MSLKIEVQLDQTFCKNSEEVVAYILPTYDFPKEFSDVYGVATFSLDNNEKKPTFCIGKRRDEILKIYFPLPNSQFQDDLGKSIIKSNSEDIIKVVEKEKLETFLYDLNEKRFIKYSDFTLQTDIPTFRGDQSVFCIFLKSGNDEEMKKIRSDKIISTPGEIKYLRLKGKDAFTDASNYRAIIASKFILPEERKYVTHFGTIFFISLLEFIVGDVYEEEVKKEFSKAVDNRYWHKRFTGGGLFLSSYNKQIKNLRSNEIIKRVFNVGDMKKEGDGTIKEGLVLNNKIYEIGESTTNILLSTIVYYGFDVLMKKLSKEKRISVTIDVYNDIIERMEIIEGVLRVKLKKNVKDPYGYLENDVLSSSNFVITS